MTRRDLDMEIVKLRARLRVRPESQPLRLKLADLLVKRGDTDEAVAVYGTVANDYAADGQLLKAVAVYRQMLRLDPTVREARWGLKQAIRIAAGDMTATSDEPAVSRAVELLEDGEAADAVFGALAYNGEVLPQRLEAVAARVAGSGRLEALAAGLRTAGRTADASLVYRALAAAYGALGDVEAHEGAVAALRETDPSELGARRREDR